MPVTTPALSIFCLPFFYQYSKHALLVSTDAPISFEFRWFREVNVTSVLARLAILSQRSEQSFAADTHFVLGKQSFPSFRRPHRQIARTSSLHTRAMPKRRNCKRNLRAYIYREAENNVVVLNSKLPLKLWKGCVGVWCSSSDRYVLPSSLFHSGKLERISLALPVNEISGGWCSGKPESGLLPLMQIRKCSLVGQLAMRAYSVGCRQVCTGCSCTHSEENLTNQFNV